MTWPRCRGYRVVSEFLAGWAKDQQAGFDLFHVIGQPAGPGTHELRDLLTRFNVPFRFHDADSTDGRGLLAGAGLGTSRLPVMIWHDGYAMVQPGQAQLTRDSDEIGRPRPPLPL